MTRRYYDPTTAQFTTPDPLYALTGSRYGYAGNDPVNGSDPTGLFWGEGTLHNVGHAVGHAWDDTGGRVVTFADEHRHQIVDVGTAVVAGAGFVACGVTVVCGVAVGAAAITVGGLAHLGVDQISHDPAHNFSVGQAFLHSTVSTGAAALCVYGLGSTCLRALAAFPLEAAAIYGAGYLWKQAIDEAVKMGHGGC